MNEDLLEHLILTRGTRFEGRLSFEGLARINGYFTGEIKTPGTLIIESAGQVEAVVFAQEVIIKGWFRGEIQAVGQVSIMKGGELYGSLSSTKLYIEPGALFEGVSLKRIPSSSV